MSYVPIAPDSIKGTSPAETPAVTEWKGGPLRRGEWGETNVDTSPQLVKEVGKERNT